MLYLISYDIPADKRRIKIARMLEGAGQRVQYSVFECDLSESQWNALQRRILKYIDLKEDSLRIYRLCGSCLGRVEIHGVGPPIERSPDVFII